MCEVKACKLFDEHQGVYRCGKSSEQILMYAIDKTANALDQQLTICSAFLDLRKAFDQLYYCNNFNVWVSMAYRIEMAY